MYLAIEMWRESGLSQLQFCKLEKLPKATFGYWLKKYRDGKGQPKPAPKTVNTFIPVEVPGAMEPPAIGTGQLRITYPNGVQLACPASLSMQQLKTLINL